MNKKFSTLVAGVLLATTSIGAFAQTVTTPPMVSGKYYLLKTQTANSYLTLSGDSLTELTQAGTLSKTQREAALWQVNYVQNGDGSYTFSFNNKKTAQPLAMAEGKAGFGGAITTFGWETDPSTNAAIAIAHKGISVPEGFNKVSIYKVMHLVKDVTLTASGTPSIGADDVDVCYEVIATKGSVAAAADLKGFKAIESLTAEDLAKSDLRVFTEDNGGSTSKPTVGGILKAGTVIYAKVDYVTNVKAAAELTFQPADVDAVDLMTSTNFADEIAPATSSSFKFDAATTSANVMADNQFEVVTRKMLVNTTTGVGQTDATDGNNYVDVPLLKVKDQEKYLAIDTTNFVASDKHSNYYKIITAGLKDLTNSVASNKVADTKYYNAADKRLAAAYMFNVKYDSQTDSLIITPKFDIRLGDQQAYWNTGVAADTTGVAVASGSAFSATGGVQIRPMEIAATYAANKSYYQISLKDFSNTIELTLVNAMQKDGVSPVVPTEVPTKISLGISTTSLNAYDLASGVYFINLVSTGGHKPAHNGKYMVNELDNWANQEAQDFNHMPNTQWVAEKAANAKTVSIWNRETGVAAFTNTIFYKEGDNAFTVGGDTLKFTKVADAFLADSTLGYFAQAKDAEKVYKLNYYSGLDNSKFVIVDESGDVKYLKVDPEEGYSEFALEATANAAKYGVEKDKIAKVLYKQSYRLYVVPSSKYIAKGDTMYMVYNADANEYRIQKAGKTDAASFNLKEYNCIDGKHYYALFDTKNSDKKVGVKDVILKLQPEDVSEVRTSSFALVEEDAPMYRRLGTTIEDGFTAKPDTAKIYLTRNNDRFLYENSVNKIALTGDNKINYLGEYNKNQFTNAAALFIDTAYVRGETNRPQYMIALRPEIGKWIDCPEGADHPQTYEYQVKADYLVNLSDSIYGQKNQDKLFKFEEKTRLAFVPAIHHGDSLIITNSKFTGNNKVQEVGKATTWAAKDTIDLSKNAFNYATFQLRLVDNGADADFYLESYKNADGAYQYVQILNGVPVLTNSIADAERFNISKTNDIPTANEGINASEVSVVASEGEVIINGAQGKKVTITNVLGQTIANTVITSDKATIAAPAGVVVVAVEGEAAVKAIVK